MHGTFHWIVHCQNGHSKQTAAIVHCFVMIQSVNNPQHTINSPNPPLIDEVSGCMETVREPKVWHLGKIHVGKLKSQSYLLTTTCCRQVLLSKLTLLLPSKQFDVENSLNNI